MAAMAPVLPYLYAATAVVAAVGAIRQGQATAAAEEFNKNVAQQNAAITEAQGAAAAQAQQREAAKRIGAATAAYGAAGVSLSEGSPLDVLEESVRDSALDAATLRYNYRLKSLGYVDQARLHGAQAGFARSASYLTAGSALLSGFSGAARAGIQFGGSGGGAGVNDGSWGRGGGAD